MSWTEADLVMSRECVLHSCTCLKCIVQLHRNYHMAPFEWLVLSCHDMSCHDYSSAIEGIKLVVAPAL